MEAEMIRKIANVSPNPLAFPSSNGDLSTAPRGSPVWCVTWFISPGLPEGSVNWPAHTGQVPSRLSALSVLAFHQVSARSVNEFSTADPVGAEQGDLRQDNELQSLEEDTRAYLHCLAKGIEPSPCLCRAWDRFFRTYTGRIHRAAKSYGLSAPDAEDCVQDVWLVILDVLRRLGHRPRWSQFSGWMHGLIRNQVVIFTRRMSRRPDHGANSLVDTVAAHDPDPATTCQQNERLCLVRHVLTDLKQQVSATDYQLVHLRWIEQREVPEVAAQLDLTSEQVWYRQHRVKKRLARLLEHHSEPSE